MLGNQKIAFNTILGTEEGGSSMTEIVFYITAFTTSHFTCSGRKKGWEKWSGAIKDADEMSWWLRSAKQSCFLSIEKSFLAAVYSKQFIVFRLVCQILSCKIVPKRNYCTVYSHYNVMSAAQLWICLYVHVIQVVSLIPTVYLFSSLIILRFTAWPLQSHYLLMVKSLQLILNIFADCSLFSMYNSIKAL